MGAVMSDLQNRRAMIAGMESDKGFDRLNALVPPGRTLPLLDDPLVTHLRIGYLHHEVLLLRAGALRRAGEVAQGIHRHRRGLSPGVVKPRAEGGRPSGGPPSLFFGAEPGCTEKGSGSTEAGPGGAGWDAAGRNRRNKQDRQRRKKKEKAGTAGMTGTAETAGTAGMAGDQPTESAVLNNRGDSGRPNAPQSEDVSDRAMLN